MMRNIAKVLSMLLIFMMAFSVAIHAEDAMTFAITTDVSSVSAGDEVVVTVNLTGTFADVALVQYKILFDATKFSVDTSTGTVGGKKKSFLCYEEDWNVDMKNGEGLGYIAYPGCGESPAGSFNVLFVDTSSGGCIDDESDLYTGTQTAIAGKIKFTALTNIDSIDSTCFMLSNCAVQDEDGNDFSVSVNQIAAAPDPTPAATVTIAKSGDDTAFLGADGGEYGSAFRITFDRPAAATSNDAIFGVTAGGTRKYSPKQTGVLAGLSGTVTLNVSFLNGSTAAGSLGVIEPKEVTAASVIMSDDAGNFFYTDEADAK